ncbi:hypothetical protein C2E23DRAFT_619594 [Lenzites betulinus]|nr:hypothetical protein C2E23DRAFT_619594 [Lenzites betulinus]
MPHHVYVPLYSIVLVQLVSPHSFSCYSSPTRCTYLEAHTVRLSNLIRFSSYIHHLRHHHIPIPSSWCLQAPDISPSTSFNLRDDLQLGHTIKNDIEMCALVANPSGDCSQMPGPMTAKHFCSLASTATVIAHRHPNC